MKLYKMPIYLIIFILAVSFVGCGGGGSGGEGSGGQDSSNAGSGTVAVFLADGPADEYDHIWIRVTDVSLIPPEGSGRDPVTVYQSSQGYEVDLLDCRDEDFLLTMRDDIPAGTYEKIRLEISGIVPVGGPCEDMDIKLPSGKIDLTPQGAFEVEQGETLVIRLDIDANKSINLHPAGGSGKCIFRPVVFVDVEPVEWQPRCPRIIKGTILQTLDKDDDGTVDGVTLMLPGNRGSLEVYVSEETVIFDDSGNQAGHDDLAKGQTVWVRGRLDGDGHFQASLVVVGNVTILKGEVETAVDSQSQQFSLLLDEGQVVTDEKIQVEIADSTFILVGCDTVVDRSTIQPGMLVRVIGKISVQEQLIRAIAILVKPGVVAGELMDVEGTIGGYNLVIRPVTGSDITVFFPQNTPIYLVGDGVVPFNLLCAGRKVRLMIDSAESEPTAREVQVQPDHVNGPVEFVNETDRTLIVDGQTVSVDEGATILDLRGSVDTPVAFDEIEISYEVSCFGLQACPPDVGFYGFIILIVEP
ncbi:MAG: DUF4382 domain-containing protein [Deltaproteobacteria bacterium]|nr:DUF4382 domain-containing protein [Deltaproteobacteria bacterium]